MMSLDRDGFRRRVLCGAGVVGVLLMGGVASGAPVMEREVIGRTGERTPIEVVRISEPGEDAMGRSADDRPALVVIAGMQGHHAIGVRVAEALGERLMDEHAGLLEGRTVYIVSRANVDGLSAFADARPRVEFGRAPERGDWDRDGRFDEDGPNDLNGDGLITMMRFEAPVERFGIEATHVVDAEDPRIVRVAEEGELATHAVMIEGVDDDGDGLFNEDGYGGRRGGGVDLDRNFPTHWPELEDGAGLYPLSRPETLALAKWMQSRENIVAVLVYGPHDTLVESPPAGRFGPAGRVPRGIEEGDERAYGVVSEAFKSATGMRGVESAGDRSGSLLQWCYADLGVWAFGTPVWVRPDLMGGGDEDGEDGVDEEAGEGEASEGDAEAAERAALLERGVPVMIVDFLMMSEEERARELAAFEESSVDDQLAMMQMIEALPEDVRARVMALGQGQADPGGAGDGGSSDDERAAGEEARGSRGGKKRTGEAARDAAWLEWIDSWEDGSEGFVSWEVVEHPQFGEVEVGGFVPGVRVNPPESMVEGVIAGQVSFVASLLEHLPVLEVDEPVVERVGEGLYRIGIRARNTGELATVPAIGVKARRLPGLVMVLDPEQTMGKDRILSGSRAISVRSLGGGGESAYAEWLVLGDDGSELELEVRSPRFGTVSFTVELEESR